MNTYECALSGVAEQGIDESFSLDGMGDLPVGWTKITMTRRAYNPKWLMLQQVKEAMVEGLTAQMPQGIQDLQRYAVMLQVEAQFHGMEKDTPMFLPDVEDTVYLSDSGDIVETINEIRGMLGLEEIMPVPTLDEVPSLDNDTATEKPSEEG